MASSRHGGIGLDEIRSEFDVSHRTAQRMAQTLGAVFPTATERRIDIEGRARWRLTETPLARLRLGGQAELTALEMAIKHFRSIGEFAEADTLASLRDRLLAAIPSQAARLAETDSEIMLEAHGLVARPGPMAPVPESVTAVIREALQRPARLHFDYRGTRRVVEPYGVLIGTRRYLVARQPERGPTMRKFRLDLIEACELADDSFARDPDFNLDSFAARSFGSWDSPDEYHETVWRFAPHAAERAAEWRFHPDQTHEVLKDGSLQVRFCASGWLEMAWHLYCWGDAVEVLSPEPLRAMVMAHRRADFSALP
ncbi:hypothetical protein LCGC14_2574400 [marine sediment metagenome]|uniref:Uncharacterized protein n=1 Tax=marine sediment metagenome TaxID=412755 RepID=A0A0F9D926_9ZZZZ